MISDENLKQLREMMISLFEEYGFKKPATLKAAANAERQRRFRERRSNADSNTKVTRRKSVRRNADSNAVSNAVAHIPIVGGTEYGVSKELLTELEAAYPGVDGPQTLLEIRVWCIANAERRKTARGMPRFLNRWFQEIQNKVR